VRSPRVDRRNARRFGSPMSFVELSAHFAVDAMPADRSVGRSAYEAALLCLTARSGTQVVRPSASPQGLAGRQVPGAGG
jgi:hypothetical protein